MLILETAGGIFADVEIFINARYGYEVRGELVCEEGTMDLARPAPGEIRHGLTQSTTFPPDWRGRFEDAYRHRVAGLGQLAARRAAGRRQRLGRLRRDRDRRGRCPVAQARRAGRGEARAEAGVLRPR